MIFVAVACCKLEKFGLKCKLIHDWSLSKQTRSFIYVILNTKWACASVISRIHSFVRGTAEEILIKKTIADYRSLIPSFASFSKGKNIFQHKTASKSIPFAKIAHSHIIEQTSFLPSWGGQLAYHWRSPLEKSEFLKSRTHMLISYSKLLKQSFSIALPETYRLSQMFVSEVV